jgi:mannosyl-oligosaccharide alpha-1,2-mannosidase
MLTPIRALAGATVLALCSQCVLAVPHEAIKRHSASSRPDNHTLNRERADAVKEAFQFAWDGYYTYAFPHDELHPVSNTYSDSRLVPNACLESRKLTGI